MYDWNLIVKHKNSRADWLLIIKFQKQTGSNLTWSQLLSTLSRFVPRTRGLSMAYANGKNAYQPVQKS